MTEAEITTIVGGLSFLVGLISLAIRQFSKGRKEAHDAGMSSSSSRQSVTLGVGGMLLQHHNVEEILGLLRRIAYATERAVDIDQQHMMNDIEEIKKQLTRLDK